MKLHELYESSKYGLPYTKEKFDALSAPSASNIEGAFKVGRTIFDNEFGLGQTPNNQNVIYAGFAIEMKPSEFLKIVSPADRDDDANAIAEKMKNLVPFGSPTLYIRANIEEWKEGSPLLVKVTGHEGRARSLASKKINDDVPIPVHVFSSGDRARDLSPEFFEALRLAGMIHQDAPKGSKPMKVGFTRVFWNGKML